MRNYIIGNDGITLCRQTPAAVNEGEIAVASVAELHEGHASTSATIGRICCVGDQGFPVVFSRKKQALSGFRTPAGRSCSGHLARRHFALCDLSGLFGKSKTSTGSRTEQRPRAKRNNGGAMVEDDPNSRQQRPRHDRLGEPPESGVNPSGRL